MAGHIRPGLSGATANELNSYWANLIRSKPDPKAPNATSPIVFKLATGLEWIPYIPLSALYSGYLTLRYWFSPRPFETWTWKRMLRNRLNRLWGEMTAWILDPYPGETAHDHNNTKSDLWRDAEVRGEVKIEVVDVPPVGEDYRFGLAQVKQVIPVTRTGFWILWGDVAGDRGGGRGGGGGGGGGGEKGNEEERVFLHIHGGGYRRGHPLWNALSLNLVRSTGIKCLSVNYRLPLTTHTAFPAPLLDALSSYIYLLNLGYRPQNIILVGKSAGGHLALMLSRYLSDINVPLPATMILLAPWLDLEMRYPSYTTNRAWDTLVPNKLAPAVTSAIRWYTPAARTEVHFNPVKATSKQWEYLIGSTVYITFGTRELFEDEIRLTVKTMREAGLNVRTREDPDGLHTGLLSDPKAMEIFLKDVRELLDVDQ